MSEVWDSALRKSENTGDVYAYAFGVAHAMIHNAANGFYDVDELVARFNQLFEAVNQRVDELYGIAERRAEKERNGAPRPCSRPFSDATVTPIFETENNGDQTGE